MTQFLHSILLGLLQGLTEFLPVSSSGHLVLAQTLLPGFEAQPAAFDVLLHGGTLAAVALYFSRDLREMAGGLTRPREGGWRLPAFLVLGTIPAGVVGVLWRHDVEALFASPMAAAAGLLVTSALLLAASRHAGGNGSMAGLAAWQVLVIGCAQAMALVPGISRSGATIAAAMVLGLAGPEAARFSFLLSLPAVAGALVLEADVLAGTGLPLHYLAGALAAAVSGWLAIAFLMGVLRRGRLLGFAVYCLALGSFSLGFLVLKSL